MIRKRLCGAIEDVRIEHALGREYPGTRLTLRTVVEKMIANGGFAAVDEQSHPADILYGFVLKSLRARVLGQTALTPLVEATELALEATFPPGAVIRLKGLLSEVPDGLHCEQDCLNLADRILKMIQEEFDQAQGGQPSGEAGKSEEKQGSDSSGNREVNGNEENENPEDDAGGNAGGKGDDQNGDDPVNGDKPLTGDQPGQPNDSDEDSPGSDSGPTNPGNGAVGETTLDQLAILEKILNAGAQDIEPDMFDAVKEILSTQGADVSEAVMPTADDPEGDEAAGWRLLHKVQGESARIRAALQGLVQAHRMERPFPRRSGRRVDGRRLHKLSLGDARLFVRQSPKPAPNTAIHLLLDRSDSMGWQVADAHGQSMGTRLPLALEATMALALAFEGIPGVNPGITAFPGDHDGSVYRMLRHGQRVRQNVGAFALAADGSTPMTQAIWFAAASLLGCREPRKLLLVVTDGQPDHPSSTLDILARCRASSIETVGIGLGIDVSHLFPVAMVINDLRELRTRLFDLSKDLLIAA